MLRIDVSNLKTIPAGNVLDMGSRQLTDDRNGGYKATLGGDSPTMRYPKPLFFKPGVAYTIQSESDAKTGKWSATAAFADDLEFQPPPAGTPVNRAGPLTLHWKTSQPQVTVVLFSQNETASVQAICAARGSDGSFTVPPDVLRSLPPTEKVTGSLTAYIGVTAASRPVGFHAPKLAKGIASSIRLRMREVEFY
jgi:hypothetical protein